MRRINAHFDKVAMLQRSLQVLHTAEVGKEYNGELEFRSMGISLSFWDIVTVRTICFLIGILGIIGNGIVLWLIYCTIKKTKFVIYVANLAVADIIVLLRSILSFVELFILAQRNLRIKQLGVLLFLFGNNTNSCFLTVISAERYLTVFPPIWYQSHRPKYSTALICAIVWIFSVTLSTIYYFLCSEKYISILNIGNFPCSVELMLESIITFMIIIPIMVLSTAALFIRLKRKPQENLPARLDISLLVIIILHLTLAESSEILGAIVFYFSARLTKHVYILSFVCYQVASSVNPFVYLLVGCWKRGKTQEPFYMFLERALRDESDSGSLRMQPPQEQA